MLVYGEVAEYVKKFASFRAYKASLEALFEQIFPYPLTYAILERYADIRRQLRPLHQDIGDIDTLIAATALEEHVTLVTIGRDFERVPPENEARQPESSVIFQTTNKISLLTFVPSPEQLTFSFVNINIEQKFFYQTYLNGMKNRL